MDSKRARIDKLVAKFAGGKKAELARRLEITKQSLNSWYKNEYIDIEKVYFTFPGVSSEWLLTGEGEMMQDSADSQLIPFILNDNLQSGNWDDKSSYIISKDVAFASDFITRIPNGDLSRCTGQGGLIFCRIVRGDSLEREHLYIIKTGSGILFVEFIGKTEDSNSSIYRFSTCRSSGKDMKIEIPANDIIQCAEIVEYTRDRLVDDVI